MLNPSGTLKAYLAAKAPYRKWTRFWMAVGALTCSTGIGASNITTAVNAAHPMCAQFLQMVKVAGVPQMTDAQLCDFRFGRLPQQMAKDFTFPKWKELQVSDPAAMYLRMIAANRAPHSVANQPQHLSSQTDAVVQAARDHNLKFYTTQLRLKGGEVTVVLMDIVRCSTMPYMREFPPTLYHATFKKENLTQPIPSDISVGGEIAIWRGNYPVLLTLFDRWGTTIGPPINIAGLLNFRWHSGKGRVDAAFTGAAQCSFVINKSGVHVNGH